MPAIVYLQEDYPHSYNLKKEQEEKENCSSNALGGLLCLTGDIHFVSPTSCILEFLTTYHSPHYLPSKLSSHYLLLQGGKNSSHFLRLGGERREEG